MKIRKITSGLVTVLTLLFFSQLTTAQNTSVIKNTSPEERAELLTDLMKSKLGLDPVQSIKVQAINQKYTLKNEPILKSNAGKFSKFKQKKKLQKEKDEELKKVFTTEQFNQYQAFEAEMKRKIKERIKQR
ncbi:MULTISPECIES: hypothetical protein [unclassified Arcicella]|uniref:hypothetical protein n=1 Tax=unclassified Arcicella TaxID=2644986 RepID=UPI002854FB53|nr:MULTISPECIES: hypothetical protein [unclassified Arcicella]MDR6561771.1 anion-transporting ArsA/GET3 family ATPase [Arcicella sp. BE51]MDR6812551.1 anion-transporting ArsA/GET3 family ATPase [Arcicella sp. BE140]MDR6823677.1 anion-transporting ArsA/GET3 family ATPase [Arcicella sp. BE139]